MKENDDIQTMRQQIAVIQVNSTSWETVVGGVIIFTPMREEGIIVLRYLCSPDPIFPLFPGPIPQNQCCLCGVCGSDSCH